MRPNYLAWEVKEGDFFEQKTELEQMKFLLRFAVLAPSGHNTQPWSFSINANEISLWVNRERSLEGSDPNRRQLLIAFGCLMENLCVAADHYGLETKITYFPDAYNQDLVAKIIFIKGDRIDKDNIKLFPAISQRHTNRGKYLDRPLPESFLKHIEKYSKDNLKVSLITDESKKHIIADIVNEAQIETMDSKEFREELSHYIKPSLTKSPTGMPGFVLEIPTPVSLFASKLIKRVNLSKASKKKDDALLKHHTPGGFIIISSKENNRESWLVTGKLFEKIWLLATSEGLNCSPMVAAIQSARHNQQLRASLGIDFEPQVFFRVGYAQKQFQHSPRFTVDDLILK
jgi:hypothetical protein